MSEYWTTKRNSQEVGTLQALVRFYARREQHSEVPARNRANIHRFLTECLPKKVLLPSAPQVDARGWIEAALAASQHFDLIRSWRMVRLIPHLYAHLLVRLKLLYDSSATLMWDGWDSLPPTYDRTGLAYVDRHELRDWKSRLHGHTFSIERDLVRFRDVCQKAMAPEMDSAVFAAGHTLLCLVVFFEQFRLGPIL